MRSHVSMKMMSNISNRAVNKKSVEVESTIASEQRSIPMIMTIKGSPYTCCGKNATPIRMPYDMQRGRCRNIR